MNSLGDRMKAYEKVSDYRLTPNSCVIIRVDGKAFHTFTRGCEKPFDPILNSCMQIAMKWTANNMDGFRLAYQQSDEITFVIDDLASHKAQGWFNFEINKLVSITASMVTAGFNRAYDREALCDWIKPKFAYFDARAFTVPKVDVPNVFVWRQKDWNRNSVEMYARSFFSHKEMHGVSNREAKLKLSELGSPWEELDNQWKYGTFYHKEKGLFSEYLDYNQISKYIFGGE